MASCITSQWSNATTPQIRLTVTGANLNAKTHRLTWKLEYVGHGYAPNAPGDRAYSVVIDGATVKSGTYDINGKSGTYTIATGTKDVSRGSSARNVSFSLSFAFNLTWSGVYGGTKSASGSISVPSVTYSTYSFNANGGSGAPGSVTKTGGVDFKFPTSKPSRTGYSFTGWNNSSINNGTLYQAGQTVTGLPDQNITWYANWKANTYTVKYNANGGSGAPGQQTKTYGVTLKLSSTKPTRTNYIFKGWGTSAGSTTVKYAAGANYTSNASITLYAIWELDYTAPKITSVTMDRCNSAGTLSDEGTYAKVGFKWSIDGNATLSSITVGWRLGGTDNSYSNTTITASGTSGTVSKVIGGSLSTENSYDIQIKVTDSKGSSTYSGQIAPMHYIVDFSPKGGVGFGGPAPNSEAAQFYESVVMDGKNIYMDDAARIIFKDIDNQDTLGIYRGGGECQLALHAQEICFLNPVGGSSDWQNSSSGGGILLGVNHIRMRNNAALCGMLKSGSNFAILRMNTSDQVEFTWTSGGLKGRVRKQLWSGTWTSGSLTISELPYYNVFLIAYSGANNDDAEHGYLIALRNAAGTRISGIGAINGGSDMRLVTVDLTVSGTKITYDSSNFVVITNGNTLSTYKGTRKIRKITGLL